MTSWATAELLTLVLLTAGVVAYYGWAVRAVGEPVAEGALHLVLSRGSWSGRRSVADLDGVSRLAIAGVMQLGFLLLLLGVLPVSWGDMLPTRPDPVLLLLGIPLGLGSAALGSQVAFFVSHVIDDRAGRQRLGMESWLAVSRGGWMRYYLRTAESTPPPVLVLLTALYVAGEEVVFRGIILLTALEVTGPAVAVGLSVALFVLAQVFSMPGWRAALFPMVGALVLGLVHAMVFIAVPDLTPLIVAHAVMFLVNVL